MKRIYEILIKIFMKLTSSDQMTNKAIRKFYKRNYNIEVGMHSYGAFAKGWFDSGIKIGRYCSLAPRIAIYRRNHPIDLPMQHPYIYKENLGFALKFLSSAETHPRRLVIEDDVWIGSNVIVTPNVDFIGRGAVVGAGSIVTKNVGRYEIVGGNPAKRIRWRFPENELNIIEKSEWWIYEPADALEIVRKVQESLLINRKNYN